MLASRGSARQGSNGVQVSLQGHNNNTADTTAIRPPVEPDSFIAFLCRSRALRLGSGGLTRDLRVGRVLGFGFWGDEAAIWMQSRALLGSGGLGCDLRVSRSFRSGSGGIKLRSACQSRALVGFRGIKSRSASQSCASFGFWGIKPRSGKSCALFGFWGNKAAICMGLSRDLQVVRSIWVLGEQIEL
ncbi:hypothetical protein B0H14DRAFT_2592015 [Mycena olivaceomarginata]|nr:hypothetical protein B0H14DRAFT_2592015 [Mycena olivaceomarginata]